MTFIDEYTLLEWQRGLGLEPVSRLYEFEWLSECDLSKAISRLEAIAPDHEASSLQPNPYALRHKLSRENEDAYREMFVFKALLCAVKEGRLRSDDVGLKSAVARIIEAAQRTINEEFATRDAKSRLEFERLWREAEERKAKAKAEASEAARRKAELESEARAEREREEHIHKLGHVFDEEGCCVKCGCDRLRDLSRCPECGEPSS